MSNFTYENQYGEHLNLEGVIEHFCDDLCGKLDCNIEDCEVVDNGMVENYYEEILKMDNGMKLEIVITFNDDEEEWECSCRQL